MTEMDASGVYGYGMNPVASGVMPSSTLSTNSVNIAGSGVSFHLQNPLFWLLVLALAFLGLFHFGVRARVARVGGAGVSVGR